MDEAFLFGAGGGVVLSMINYYGDRGGWSPAAKELLKYRGRKVIAPKAKVF